MYGDNGIRFSSLKMEDEALLKMLRCLAEDMIFEKYRLEIEQIHKYLQCTEELTSACRSSFSGL
jgi:Zn finger protein HypA/HybF involved in hydrogenase expression